MPNIYSTLTNSMDFAEYAPQEKGAPHRVSRKVTIKGGTGVANKHFVTPLGVVTYVSDDELAFLLKNDSFETLIKRGFMVVGTERAIDPEVVAADMVIRDKSSPQMPQDYSDDALAKPSEGDQPGVVRSKASEGENIKEKFKKAFRG